MMDYMDTTVRTPNELNANDMTSCLSSDGGGLPVDRPATSTAPDGVVSCDPATLALFHRVKCIARSDASVLVRGESGTGKEVVARYIHRHSTRSRGPFVAVNCAAIPEQLLESELFGHERGAFSGALTQRIGKLEAAQNGTILLDEISEMDRKLQAKLLRAIQEREIDRVGGRNPVRLNVRIVATTNVDLEAEIKKGTFRSDLYFRLNVVGVRVPNLRDRPADIPALAEHFLCKYANNDPRYRSWLCSAAMAALAAHPWPGNVRELENTIHRAVVLSGGDRISTEMLELEPSAEPQFRIHGQQMRFPTTGRTLQALERDAILGSLEITGGNRTRAALMLGLSIRSLRNKINEYSAEGIPVPNYIRARAP